MVIPFDSNTAFANPLGVALRMFLVLSDLPPSFLCWSEYPSETSTGIFTGSINPFPCHIQVLFG